MVESSPAIKSFFPKRHAVAVSIKSPFNEPAKRSRYAFRLFTQIEIAVIGSVA
jgi:hypothetical protein